MSERPSEDDRAPSVHRPPPLFYRPRVFARPALFGAIFAGIGVGTSVVVFLLLANLPGLRAWEVAGLLLGGPVMAALGGGASVGMLGPLTGRWRATWGGPVSRAGGGAVGMMLGSSIGLLAAWGLALEGGRGLLVGAVLAGGVSAVLAWTLPRLIDVPESSWLILSPFAIFFSVCLVAPGGIEPGLLLIWAMAGAAASVVAEAVAGQRTTGPENGESPGRGISP